jgi:regulator of sirC expression with transglutaminase-like and TPR domain
MTVTKSEIESLVFLMDDPDEFVRDSVNQRFFQLGEASVPLLDSYRAGIKDPKVKTELSRIIHQITFDGLQQEFITLIENGIYNLDDLEEGVFLLSRFDDPTMRTRQYKVMLDGMASELEPRIYRAGSMIDKMQVVLEYLYSEQGFEGCHSDYLNPNHSFLHHVIANKTGIPLSLAMVLLFLANRLKLPFHGVNMPLHFLVKFESDNGKTMLIDPFNNGGILTREQCMLFLKKSGIKPVDAHFNRAPELEMFTRFVRNLINGYQQQNDAMKSTDLARLLGILEASRF